MGRKRKPGRPKGSKTKKRKKVSTRSRRKRRLPPRIQTGKRKGQFKKRKKRRS